MGFFFSVEDIIEGGVEFFGSKDLANFWFGISVVALKICGVLGFGVLCGLLVFSKLVFGFRFLDFSRKLHPAVALKL